MIWIDENMLEFEYAVNALNYDKLGHETGLGSRGIIAKTVDSYSHELVLFIGIKMDVITVMTNRFVTSFVNVPATLKEKINKIRSGSGLKTSLSQEYPYVPDPDSENVVQIYIDIHRIDIDVVELANMVYDRVTPSEEYLAISRDKVFKIGTKRTARAISATMQRVYEGNLENFGYIFTKNEKLIVMNEMIVDSSIIDDEIRYTVWLTPHDLKEYKFVDNYGRLFFEEGDEYVEGLGSELVSCVKTDRLFKYDRRGFRNGYWDITVENPVVNHGYSNGTDDVYDTMIFSVNDGGRMHKHKALVGINSSYNENVSTMIKRLIVPEYHNSKNEIVESVFTIPLKKSILQEFEDRGESFFEKYEDGMHIDLALATLGSIARKIIPATRGRIVELFNNTFISPFFSLNILHDWETVNTDTINDSIIFMYHPILDSFVFYEMGENDTATITNRSIKFSSDGLMYGFDMNGSEGVFTWGNIDKLFRNTSSKFINAVGEIHEVGYEGSSSDPIVDIAINTDSKVKIYDDLIVNGSAAMVFVVNKKDIKSIISKREGELSGEFILGRKTGDIKIVRDGLWM
jgi:hypothetical protein